MGNGLVREKEKEQNTARLMDQISKKKKKIESFTSKSNRGA